MEKTAELCLGATDRGEVILDRRLLRSRNYNGENEQQSGDRHTYGIYTKSLYMSPAEPKKSPSIFFPILFSVK